MKRVTVSDKMQKVYIYELTEPVGENFDDIFLPELTPKEMLELGVFGGKYLNDCKNEFPKEWFINAKLSTFKNIELNYFSADASQSLSEWQKKGGFTTKILGVGFSGIADISWAEEHHEKIYGK